MIMLQNDIFCTGYVITSPPEGVVRYSFHPVCLCVCVCLSVCVSGQYFGILFLHRSKVKVTGTVHCFLSRITTTELYQNFNVFS